MGKREHFRLLAERRTNKILKALETLGHCSNPYQYEWTDEEIEKIFQVIEERVQRTKAKFEQPGAFRFGDEKGDD
jgi:hypothetical protein